jgi:hypothetical protein
MLKFVPFIPKTMLLSSFICASTALHSCTLSYNTLSLMAGMMLSYLKGAYLSWRTAAWTSVIYVVIPILLISIWIPESPVWLVARGRVDEAEKSLKWLSGDKVRLPMFISTRVCCRVYEVQRSVSSVERRQDCPRIHAYVTVLHMS